MSETHVTTYANFGELPEVVKDFLYDPEDADSPRIVDEAGLSGSQLKIFFGETEKVYLKKTPTTSLFAVLKPKLPELTEDKLKKLVCDFIGYRLLPIDDFLDGQASAALSQLGIDPSSYQIKRITIRILTPSSIVTEFLHEHPVNVPAFLEHRLREILESRVREVRKDAETITRLTRAEKIGGVELPQAEAEALVEALSAKIASVKIAADAPPAPPVPEIRSRENEAEAIQASDEQGPSLRSEDMPQPTTVPVTAANAAATIAAAATAASVVSKKGHAFMPQDEQEADAIRTKVLPRVVSESLFDMEEEIKKGTEAVFGIYGLTLPENLKGRFKTIITSRLKGIRDRAETEDLLVRTAAIGGMGFGNDSAARILRAIEEQAAIVNGKREEEMKKEKEVFVKQSIAATFAKDESRKKGDLEELDRMYSSLTGKVAERTMDNGQRTTPAAADPALLRPRGGDQQSTTKPAAPTIVEPTKPPEPIASKPQPVPPAPAPAPLPSRPQPMPVPVPAKPSVVAPPPVPTARMQDVRPVASVARLTGPAEELNNMTLVDFRRLSADPVEACRKIVDKLDLLEEHSYAKRIEGIKAWQQSEVNKLYLQVIMAAFSGGKPIADAIAENQAANRETLTEREVHAIMELNKGLKA